MFPIKNISNKPFKNNESAHKSSDYNVKRPSNKYSSRVTLSLTRTKVDYNVKRPSNKYSSRVTLSLTLEPAHNCFRL